MPGPVMMKHTPGLPLVRALEDAGLKYSDIQTVFLPPAAKDQAVFVNLDVTNLLDKKIVGATETSGLPTFEVGRQFMLEVGYTF